MPGLRSIVVFRFHNRFDVCAQRIRALRLLNPGIPVVGLYGGPPGSLGDASSSLGQELDGIYPVSYRWPGMKGWIKRRLNRPQDLPPNFAWRHCDIALGSWFREHGSRWPFDRLYLVEWDLLYLCSLQEAYSHVPQEAVGLTALVPLDRIAKRWYWVSVEPYRSQWATLYSLVKGRYHIDDIGMGSMGPGACFPRAFLDAYAREDVPMLCNMEVRLPLFAQALGFPLVDTGFFKRWFEQEETKYFNCDEQEIEPSIIEQEAARPDGRRVFHPFRQLPTPGIEMAISRVIPPTIHRTSAEPPMDQV